MRVTGSTEKGARVTRTKVREAFFAQGSELPGAARMADALHSLGLDACLACGEAFPDLCEPCAVLVHGARGRVL